MEVVMQKRERLLAGAVVLLVGGWLIDGMVVQPAVAWFAATDKETQAATREAAEANVLIDRQARILSDWRSRHAAGLIDNEDQARFRLQRTLQDAAKASGFTISSVGGGHLVPATQEQVYDLLRLSVSGHGALDQVQHFVAALEGAAMPLKIERCELSSGDARKDALDAALTLSTRLVGENARAGRGVPDGTLAWKPEPRSRTLDEAIHAARPFLADRRYTAPRAPRETREEPPASTTAATPVSKAGWALVGIVAGDRETLAFVRHQGDGEERVLRTGDQLDGQQVVGIDHAGLRLAATDGEHLVAVGQDLTGQAVTGVITATTGSRRDGRGERSDNGTPTVSPAAAAAPFQIPTVTSDPAREAILQRLRQQRNRAP
jgi:hypothetical protein